MWVLGNRPGGRLGNAPERLSLVGDSHCASILWHVKKKPQRYAEKAALLPKAGGNWGGGTRERQQSSFQRPQAFGGGLAARGNAVLEG